MRPFTNRVASAALALGIFCTQQLAAQEDEAPAEPAPPINVRAVLAKTFEKMSLLQGLAFESSVAKQHGIGGRFGGLARGGANGQDVAGSWMPETATYEIGDAEIVQHRGRWIARSPRSDWVPRARCMANGAPLPFLFDPAVFFGALAALQNSSLEVMRCEKTERNGKPLLIVNLTLEDAGASELVFRGAMPRAESGNFVVMRMLGVAAAPQLDLTTDIALWIDPESHLVERIVAKSYDNQAQAGFAAGGGVVMRIGAGGGGPAVVVTDQKKDDKEVEPAEAAQVGDRYEDGVFVREDMKEKGCTTFTIDLSGHDRPFVPDLDAKTKRLLRMR